MSINLYRSFGFVLLLCLISLTVQPAGAVDSATEHLTLYYKSETGKQPYCLYVPNDYAPVRSYPLVVALHGAGDDEKRFFTKYDKGIIKNYGEKQGMLIVCPRGDSRYGTNGPDSGD